MATRLKTKTKCIPLTGHAADGGGFFPRLPRLGENVLPFIARLRFFFFFRKWRLARLHYFHFFGQDQSTVAQRAETTVAERPLISCV